MLKISKFISSLILIICFFSNNKNEIILGETLLDSTLPIPSTTIQIDINNIPNEYTTEQLISSKTTEFVTTEDSKLPQIPSTTILFTTIPSTTIPSTTTPSTTIPSTTIPSTTIPSTTIPSTTIPSTTVLSSPTPSTIIQSTTIPFNSIPSTTTPFTTTIYYNSINHDSV